MQPKAGQSGPTALGGTSDRGPKNARFFRLRETASFRQTFFEFSQSLRLALAAGTSGNDGTPPLAQRPSLVAGGDPVAPGPAPILRPLGQPCEAVARAPPPASGGHSRECRSRRGTPPPVSAPAPAVPDARRDKSGGRWWRALGQGSGKSRKALAIRGAGQHVEQVARGSPGWTAGCPPCPRILAQQHRDAVDVGLAADDPHVGIPPGLMHHVLAADRTRASSQVSRPPNRAGRSSANAIRVRVPIDRTGAEGIEVFLQIRFLAVAQGACPAAGRRNCVGAVGGHVRISTSGSGAGLAARAAGLNPGNGFLLAAMLTVRKPAEGLYVSGIRSAVHSSDF